MISRALVGARIVCGCLLVGALMLRSTNPSLAQTTGVIISHDISLNRPTVWTYRDLIIQGPINITTNGNPFVLTVTGDLSIIGRMNIISYPLDPSPPPPPQPATNGSDGSGYPSGPGTEGLGAPGPSGMPGSPGRTGAPGRSGFTPGQITITVVGQMSGILRIIHRGSSGRAGGRGGLEAMGEQEDKGNKPNQIMLHSGS